MDDVAEKARRNLMMLATGINVVSVLGIPLEGQLIGVMKLENVEPVRAWLCVLIALVYFGLRFHLAPENAQVRDAWKIAKSAQLERRFQAMLESEYTRFLEKKTTRFAFKLPEIPGVAIEPGPISGIHTTVWLPNHRGGKFHFQMLRPLNIPEARNAHNIFGEAPCSFAIPRATAYRIRIANLYEAYRRLKWNSLEVSLPYVWAAIATIVCVCKLAISFYYEFPFVRQLLQA